MLEEHLAAPDIRSRCRLAAEPDEARWRERVFGSHSRLEPIANPFGPKVLPMGLE
jgi:hypothetical protein